MEMLPDWIGRLESHGELVDSRRNHTPDVRAELLAMFAATIDRYLSEHRTGLDLKGILATRAGTLYTNLDHDQDGLRGGRTQARVH